MPDTEDVPVKLTIGQPGQLWMCPDAGSHPEIQLHMRPDGVYIIAQNGFTNDRAGFIDLAGLLATAHRAIVGNIPAAGDPEPLSVPTPTMESRDNAAIDDFATRLRGMGIKDTSADERVDPQPGAPMDLPPAKPAPRAGGSMFNPEPIQKPQQ